MELYTKDNIRLTLVATNGRQPLNWLFLPGGPGADASYFEYLTEHLELPGNSWLVDLPGNGDHVVSQANFEQWSSLFMNLCKSFDNPIVVGHSFGAMLPLLNDEYESVLKGFVALSSAPSLWLEAADQCRQKLDLPDLKEEMAAFIANPSDESFKAALMACTPYYFPKQTLERGRELLGSLPFNFDAAVWWQRKVVDINYDAKWVPSKIPMMIVHGEFDAITPAKIYHHDQRFDRDNITKHIVPNAGHMPWIEEPEKVAALFPVFMESLFELDDI